MLWPPLYPKRPNLTVTDGKIIGFVQLAINEMIWMIECVMCFSFLVVLIISYVYKDVLSHCSTKSNFKRSLHQNLHEIKSGLCPLVITRGMPSLE